MAKRLTEHHPLTKKLRALENYMQDAGIFIEWDGYHMVVSDAETKARIKDNDNGQDLTEMPYCCETKLIIED